MLGKIVMTFIWCLGFLAFAILLVPTVRWTWRRQAQPGYAPLWVWAVVGAVVVSFALLGAARMAVGLEPGRTGAHRKPRRAALPGPARFPAP